MMMVVLFDRSRCICLVFLSCVYTSPAPPLHTIETPVQVFRRWDGQATLIANNLMAKKAIRNQWRSSPYLHHTMISVSADTPMEKLDQMKAGIAAGLRVRGRSGLLAFGACSSHRRRAALFGTMDGIRPWLLRDRKASCTRCERAMPVFLSHRVQPEVSFSLDSARLVGARPPAPLRSTANARKTEARRAHSTVPIAKNTHTEPSPSTKPLLIC